MQTPEGIEKFKKTMREKYGEKGPDGKSPFHKRIGRAGGTAPYKGKKGFASMPPERVRELAAQAGRTPKRKPKDSQSDKVGG